MNLSNRAAKLVSEPSPIMIGHATCAENPYSLGNNEGYLNFGTAENHLISDLLLPKINDSLDHSPEHIQYNPLHGTEDFRVTVAEFLQKNLHSGQINPEYLTVQAGVSAICESLSFCMFDEGDYLIIPTPYYTGFDHDFTKRFGVNFLKAHLDPNKDFAHDIEAFKKAYNDCNEKDKIKGVLITDPHNPTGEILADKFKAELIEFCLDKNIALITDEIYALSRFDGSTHDSLFKKASEAGVDTHLLYGMAKDFALAGLKVGFYYSENQTILNSMQNISYFHPVGTSTQLAVQKILGDDEFLSKFIPENQNRLKAIPILLAKQLAEFRFIFPNAGLFMMLDLSKYCESFDKEKEIFDKLLNDYKINISPGSDLGLTTPGYFRVCFAQKKENVLEFIVRMKKFYSNELS